MSNKILRLLIEEISAKVLFNYISDASECKGFAGRLTAAGDTKIEKTDTENYSIVHLLDNMAGKIQGLLLRAENSHF